eukprot:COSAG01_NODE_1805_length_9192_cov_13.807324_14_plen_136_part_00
MTMSVCESATRAKGMQNEGHFPSAPIVPLHPPPMFISQTEAARRRALETQVTCQVWQALADQRLTLPQRWCAAIHPSWSHRRDFQRDTDAFAHIRLRWRLNVEQGRLNILPAALSVYSQFIILDSRGGVPQAGVP